MPMKGQCTNTLLDGKFEGIQGIPINSNMILTGLPSSGKSLLCMQLALNLASSGVRVCYVTSEEIFKSEAGRYSLEARMAEKAKLLEQTCMTNIKKCLFVIDTVKNAELREWVNFVGEYRRLVANQKIEFLIIDSITMLEDNRTQMKNRLLDLTRFNQTHGVTSIMINQRSVEESMMLETPLLEKNLIALSTIASIATMVGLLGTVIGMIRAFKALAQAGAPDAISLATGISEALINTAFGIGTGALAVVMYNYFTTKIDKLTYSIDEAGYSIVQTFASKH